MPLTLLPAPPDSKNYLHLCICKSLFQTTLEKQNRALHGDIGDKTQRLDDLHTSLAEADITKKKLSVEKADLEKQIDEADKTLRALGKIKSSLTTQVSSTFF